MENHLIADLDTTLPNGLRVIIKAVRTAPIATFWVWYNVGSRFERTGQTGVSHWVEHMQFKGSAAFPDNSLEQLVSRTGGAWNAFTSFDYTAYFEVMPAGEIDLAMRLEADRMCHATYAEAEVESERTVIISERQGHENDPFFLLGEEVQAAAFRVHPYHHEIIGDQIDIETMSRADLYGHYRKYYQPNNATVVLVGDVDLAASLARITELFGAIPHAPLPSAFHRPEPAQIGERRVQVSGPGESSYFQVLYHIPAATDPDFFAMLVLESCLSGPSSLNQFGGSTSNRTSRLYKALVLGEKAAFISGYCGSLVEPGMYTFSAMARPGVSLAELEASFDAEIAQVCAEPLSSAEIEKTRKQAKAAFAFSAESVSNLGYWYGFSAILGEPEWFTHFLERLNAVTAADVQRVAQNYLRKANRTVGWYIPHPSDTVSEESES
jgi:zinc protease